MNILQLFGGVPIEDITEEQKQIIMGEVIHGKSNKNVST